MFFDLTAVLTVMTSLLRRETITMKTKQAKRQMAAVLLFSEDIILFILVLKKKRKSSYLKSLSVCLSV